MSAIAVSGPVPLAVLDGRPRCRLSPLLAGDESVSKAPRILRASPRQGPPQRQDLRLPDRLLVGRPLPPEDFSELHTALLVSFLLHVDSRFPGFGPHPLEVGVPRDVAPLDSPGPPGNADVACLHRQLLEGGGRAFGRVLSLDGASSFGCGVLEQTPVYLGYQHGLLFLPRSVHLYGFHPERNSVVIAECDLLSDNPAFQRRVPRKSNVNPAPPVVSNLTFLFGICSVGKFPVIPTG
jgi:hypothetical protein